MKYLYKYTNIEISNLFLSLLILSINVNGPDFFKTKELFFVLFVGSSLQYGNYKHLLELFIMISVMLISACLNLLIPGSDLTLGGIISNTLGLVYLILLVFNNDLFKETIIKTYLVSAVLVAILISSIWIICSLNSVIRYALVNYFSSIKNDKVAFIMMIRNRKIFKWWVLGVYCGTAPCMIPALGYFLIDRLNHRTFKNLLVDILLTSALIMTEELDYIKKQYRVLCKKSYYYSYECLHKILYHVFKCYPKKCFIPFLFKSKGMQTFLKIMRGK